jgi:hypothetical protein
MNCCNKIETDGPRKGARCGSFALNEHPESGLCDRCYQEERAERAEALLAEYKLGLKRYEKLRRLSIQAFSDLWIRNMTEGIPFDTLVDQLEVRND